MPDPISRRSASTPPLADPAAPGPEAPAASPAAPKPITTDELARTVKGAEGEREAAKLRRFIDAQRTVEKEVRPSAREVGMCKTVVSNPVKALAIVGFGAVGAAASPNKVAGGVGGAAVGAIVGGIVGDAAAALLCEPVGTK